MNDSFFVRTEGKTGKVIVLWTITRFCDRAAASAPCEGDFCAHGGQIQKNIVRWTMD